MLVGLQEEAAGREGAVEGGGQADDICGDVGEDSWSGLVVVSDLKANTSGQTSHGNKRFLSLPALGRPWSDCWTPS